MAEFEEILERALDDPANAGLLTRYKTANEMEETLKEAIRAEVDRRPTIDVKRPTCEVCGARRTATFPCKHCYPEDWTLRRYGDKSITKDPPEPERQRDQ